TIDGRPAMRDEQTLTQTPPAGGPLRIQAARNSGMSVQGWDRRDVQVLVCKAAPSAAELAAIRVGTDNGQLAATGPSEESWYAYFIVQAPRAIALDLDTTNGPITLEGLTGHVKARAQNGPIAIRECPGTLDAQAQNGPIN